MCVRSLGQAGRVAPGGDPWRGAAGEGRGYTAQPPRWEEVRDQGERS